MVEIIGNQPFWAIIPELCSSAFMQVKQLHDWLAHWDEKVLHTDKKGKGKKVNDPTVKKAVLLSGTPGIGKTTSAKLVSQMLGFQPIEVEYSICKFI